MKSIQLRVWMLRDCRQESQTIRMSRELYAQDNKNKKGLIQRPQCITVYIAAHDP